MYTVLFVACLIAIQSAESFYTARMPMNGYASTNMVATEKAVASIEGPDFYWQYRLERLSNRMGSALPFNAKNYPDVSGFKDLYNAYYLDLTLQGKLDGFDWEAEKKVSDVEWQTIYNSISKWTKDVAKKYKPDNKRVPENDFDLLKQYYPQLNFRDLEIPFVVEEVGPNFPYKTMKDLISAAANGKLNIPGYSTVTSLDADDARAELEQIKTEGLKRIDAIYEKVLAFANNPFPDEQSKKHYQALKQKLGTFPQSEAEWKVFKENVEKEVDEMAKLASKRDDHHGHHEEAEEAHGHHEEKLSPAQEFEAKYGRSLEEMQERFSRFKSDPVGFLEASIIESHGKSGLEVWKKSQEFSARFAVLSPAERAKIEKEFADFLSKA